MFLQVPREPKFDYVHYNFGYSMRLLIARDYIPILQFHGCTFEQEKPALDCFPYRLIHLLHTQNLPKNYYSLPSYPLIRTGTSAYHGVRNINFSEKYICVPNG